MTVRGAGRWEIPETGMWGFSHCAFYDSYYPWSGVGFEGRVHRMVDDLGLAGADSFRPHIHWHRVEPLLTGAAGGPGDVTGEEVEIYSRGCEGIAWASYDLLIDSLVDAGIEPHVVLGAGYDFQIPVIQEGNTFQRAVPDRMGKDSYLGRLFLHARAAVRRYRGRVHVWQLENELNAACETMLLARWRSGRSWMDRGFQTALMEVLCEAVRTEDPSALTSHNFHTDIRIVRGVYDWREDVRRWLEFLDIVGVDAYPNYLLGWPVRGAVVGRKVKQALEVSGRRPVMVLESGYPTKPRYRFYSEARQAAYVRDAVSSAVSRGACGFYYYTLCSPEGYPVEGPWSNKFVQNIEPWWGMVRRDDSYRPAWFEYRISMDRARSGQGGGPG